MTTQQQVMIGLVATALAASLAANVPVPAWIMSLLLVLAGIGLTYYVVLNQKRKEQLENFGLLLKGCRRMGEQNSVTQVMDELGRTAALVTEASYHKTYLIPQGGGQDSWAPEISGWIMQNRRPLIINSKEKHTIPPLPDTKLDSLLAVPLMDSDQITGILCLGNKKNNQDFSCYDQQMAEKLCEMAVPILTGLFYQQEQREVFKTTIKSITGAIEQRQEGFTGHAARVAAISVLLGQKLGLSGQELQELEYSALLHDIGKIVIPATTAEEEEPEFDGHPVWGADIFPADEFFTPIKENIRYHHERYNGSGFPTGRSKNDIPLPARIIAVADFYDALTRLCPEEERLLPHQAVEVIKKATGTLLDPLVVVALEEVEEEVKEVTLSDDNYIKEVPAPRTQD
ncbi:MAG: GAF and HD-GYP domain-containing protein [Syntrophomonadaceae bacterium]|jgi:hypothetical protein